MRFYSQLELQLEVGMSLESTSLPTPLSTQLMVLMGHRGGGKTTVLRRWETSQRDLGLDLKFLDLDEEIQRHCGRSLREIFETPSLGESFFRKKEMEVFRSCILDFLRSSEEELGETSKDHQEYQQELHKQEEERDQLGDQKSHLASGRVLIFSVGGGFPVGEILSIAGECGLTSREVHRVWLQRPTDFLGRICFQRPRLSPEGLRGGVESGDLRDSINLTDLEESLLAYRKRTPLFWEHCDSICALPEGNPLPLLFTQEGRGGFPFVTLSPWLLRRGSFLRTLYKMGCGFEWRSDFWNPQGEDALVKGFQDCDPERLLFSLRSPDFPLDRLPPLLFGRWDGALELGIFQLVSFFKSLPLSFRGSRILSAHDRLSGETIGDFLLRLEEAAILIETALFESGDSLKPSDFDSDFNSGSDAGSTLERPHLSLKAAPFVYNFSELQSLWMWQREDPQRRSVLPRTPPPSSMGLEIEKSGVGWAGSGAPMFESREDFSSHPFSPSRWNWFRLLQRGHQELNFIRLGWEGPESFWSKDMGFTGDQPTLTQWFGQSPRSPRWAEEGPGFGRGRTRGFGAILGDPVFHSRTPVEQGPFFAHWGWPVVAVPMGEEDFGQGLRLLIEMGLVGAAVTSPLKVLAKQLCTHTTPRAQKLGSVNTLFVECPGLSSGVALASGFPSSLEGEGGGMGSLISQSSPHRIHVYGTNTDGEGFSRYNRGGTPFFSPQDPVVIWGGGGTLPILQDLFPRGVSFSIRTQAPRQEGGPFSCQASLLPSDRLSCPRGLVWAGGPRALEPESPHLHLDLRELKWVLDLNYREDSQARAFAKKLGCEYFSGESFFDGQAEGQRRFWSRFLVSSESSGVEEILEDAPYPENSNVKISLLEHS